jgi:hypothetical protein
LATLARARRQLKRTIKQNPVLWDAFSRMRAAARAAMPEGASETSPRHGASDDGAKRTER